MVKGLEGIKGINWEVKEGEYVIGRYEDQKGNKATIGILEPCTEIACCMIYIKSKTGRSQCKLLKREEEIEFTKICQDILPDIEAYNYNPLEGWHFSLGEDD